MYDCSDGFQEFVRRADNHGLNPRYETKEQASVVQFVEDVASIEPRAKRPSGEMARREKTAAPRPTALTLAQSSLSPPKDRSAIRIQRERVNPTTYTINLTELDTAISAQIKEYDDKVSRAIAFASKNNAEQKQGSAKTTNVLRDMRRKENSVGRPAENMIDNSHVSSVIVARSGVRAHECLERQVETLHASCFV
ncbi:hypothetical protein E4U42_005776 [Claviceps africana]|uniref:Uncharacterized protein n=1 Tax=Claviceps africana TaxID=83212 RepID=A0A8K0NJS7_9HYPO|nr:hypothetical protein E4U42_005776 [Claviceps africana]